MKAFIRYEMLRNRQNVKKQSSKADRWCTGPHLHNKVNDGEIQNKEFTNIYGFLGFRKSILENLAKRNM